MTEFQNKSTKKVYVKSKLIVKRWEEEFSNKNGRLPTKADIKLSPAYVRESYNRYYKIKTELLASQILVDDNLLNTTLSNISVLDHAANNETPCLNVETNNEISNTNVIEHHESDDESKLKSKNKIDSKTWGENLNVSKVNSVENKGNFNSLNILSQKLFKGSKFKKRNPRKNLSFSKKKLDLANLQSNNTESIKSVNNCNVNLNFSSNDNNNLNESSLIEESESLVNLEDSINSSTRSFSSSFLTSSLFPNSQLIPPGVSHCTIFNEKQTTSVQKLSLIQELSDGTCKSIQDIHEGWVERCTDSNERNSHQRNSDSGFDSLENTPPNLTPNEKQSQDSSSDDDIICDSDNENDTTSNCNNVLKIKEKRKAAFLNDDSTEETTNVSQKSDELSVPPVVHSSKKIKLSTPDNFSKVHNEKSTKKNILERKIKSGTLNENYVKINLDRKIYSRGKKQFNFSNYKKQQWKKNKKQLDKNLRESGGSVNCYKCGKEGHFGSKCKVFYEDKLLEETDESIDNIDTLPTLEEAQKMVEEKNQIYNLKNKYSFSSEQYEKENLNIIKLEAYYQPTTVDGDVINTPKEVYDALKKFGHSKFRPGQEKTIMRILSGMSTILMISTGGGKSLCYQLPAYLYAKKSKCITLVISPLVSLMEDQVSGSSSIFKAGCLNTSQTEKQRESVLEDLNKGKLHALLVSPEAVVSGDSYKGLGCIFKKLPPIAFACIDEVHCISQWSHNFRPSYLMINKVLKEKFGVTTILGLTATATISTVKSIANELGLSSEKDTIKDILVPDNLFLTVFRDSNKDEALIQLLKSSKFQEFNSILIYCTRRDDCEKLAVLLRTVLQNSVPLNSEEKKGKKLSWSAESYHAGMASARRRQIQKAFMTGNLRIVVATVAFGMGINKPDIRAVIHYNMPKDFESYVQETGRCGRDGLPAYCYLFLDPEGRDLCELRRHIYSNALDRYTLRKLLQRIFVDCKCKEQNKKCEGHEVAFNINDTIQALDVPEENIYTLLCYLELHEKKFIKVLAPAYINCRIKSYKGVKQIISAAVKCPPLAYVCALNAQNKKKNLSFLEFNIMDVAKEINWDSSLVKKHLKNLEWEMKEDLSWKKTGIIVEFCDLGFRVLAKGDMSEAEQDEALDYLTERVKNEEKRSSHLLNLTFSAFNHFAFDKFDVDVTDEENSNNLKTAIKRYFETETMAEEILLKNLEMTEFDEEAVASDVRSLLCTYRDTTFNARSVARIFHGIQSPNYPASLWYNCRFWRKHIDKDFNRLIQIAKLEILRQKF